MTPRVIGIILIIFGMVNIIKPETFRKLMSHKITFSPQRYSREDFRIIIRMSGVILIIIGVLLTLIKV